VILGGQDGVVNTLGLILGVAAVSNDTKIILAAGLAAIFAECISMGAVEYTSSMANNAYYKSEVKRERRHIKRVPDIEKKEIYEMYEAKGFSGTLLEEIVDTITNDRDIWVNEMMMSEFQISPVTRCDAIKSAFVVLLSSMIGSFLPLLPFFFLSPYIGIWISLGFSALALFIVGVYKSLVMKVGNPFLSGLEMAIIGIVSAVVGWVIGFGFDLLWKSDTIPIICNQTNTTGT